MKAHREPSGLWVISFARGDTVRDPIESFAKEHSIVGAKISGIGALEDPELGCYDLATKTYDRRTFNGIWELLSIEGNLSLKDGEPFLHAHVTISGHDYAAMGGHLFDSKVGVVMELFVDPLATPLHRYPCEAIGLPRWEPGG